MRLLATLLLIRPVRALGTTSPEALTYRLILFGSVTFPNLEPTCNSFTDATGSCFSYNLSSTSPPLGSFCSVQSPPPTLRLLSTLLPIRLVPALATTTPPTGSFCSVQSPPPTLCLLATLLLMRPVCALATTSLEALTYNTP